MKSIHTWTPKKLRKRSERPQNQENKKSARGGNGETKLTLSSKSPSAFHNVEIFIGLRIIILQSTWMVILVVMVKWPEYLMASLSPSSLFAFLRCDCFRHVLFIGFGSTNHRCTTSTFTLITIDCDSPSTIAKSLKLGQNFALIIIMNSPTSINIFIYLNWDHAHARTRMYKPIRINFVPHKSAIVLWPILWLVSWCIYLYTSMRKSNQFHM